MKRLEYLSGFSIGHITKKMLEEASKGELIVIEDFLHKNYYQLWSIFYSDGEFLKGLKRGLIMNNLPELVPDFKAWFEILKDHLGY